MVRVKIRLLRVRYNGPDKDDRLNVDHFEVEEDIRPDFPCPYCYEDFDIASLCSHLEDEHSCESRATINVSISRFVLFALLRRRRLRRVAVPNSQALSLLGRDLREAHLHVLLGGGGGGGCRSSNITSSSATAAVSDPFLSSLVLNFPGSDADEISKSIVSNVEESSVKIPTPQHIWKSSFDPSLSFEERENRMRQATGRAVFLQDLMVSTLFAD
ncbi:dehydration-induced 19-like protein [Tanacetum coccineum]